MFSHSIRGLKIQLTDFTMSYGKISKLYFSIHLFCKTRIYMDGSCYSVHHYAQISNSALHIIVAWKQGPLIILIL